MVGGGFHQRRTKQKKTYLLFSVDSLDEIIQCKHMFKHKKKELSQKKPERWVENFHYS
jgi:hypothetical protein